MVDQFTNESEWKNQILNGDCLEVLKRLPDCSVSAIVTDPPYAIGNKEPTPQNIIDYLNGAELNHGGDFKGNKWQLPTVAVWKEVYRVLKPGGYLAAFAATRTMDLMSLGIRAAGFTNRDTIFSFMGPSVMGWVTGQGMPKSRSVLKTDIIPIIENQLKQYGLPTKKFLWAHLQKEASDLEVVGQYTVEFAGKKFTIDHLGGDYFALPEELEVLKGLGTGLKPSVEPVLFFRKPIEEDTLWCQVLKTSTGAFNIDSARVKHANQADLEKHAKGVQAIKERGGSMANSWKNSSDLSGANDVTDAGRWPANVTLTHSSSCVRSQDNSWQCIEGCPALEMDQQYGEEVAKYFSQFEVKAPFFYSSKANHKESTANGKIPNEHPTRKPLSLMGYLVKMVTPPGGIVLDPYCGSGSTCVAAVQAGVNFVGIEKDPQWIPTGRGRIEEAYKELAGAAEPVKKTRKVKKVEAEPDTSPTFNLLGDLFED